MNARVLHAVTGRLSLRPPQAESLTKLVRALDAAPELLGHEQDVSAILSTLKAEFSTLEDFEREFPSLCFAVGAVEEHDAVAVWRVGQQVEEVFLRALGLGEDDGLSGRA